MSCALNENKSKILGEWELTSWKVGNSNENITGKMTFMFEENGRYEVDYGNDKEKGSYYVEGNNLYTTEDGQMKKMVRLVELNQEVMSFEMNRSGRLEVAAFKRVNR